MIMPMVSYTVSKEGRMIMMEKGNIINVVVSMLLIGVGIAFLLYAWHIHVKDLVLMIVAFFLILYGILRIVYTNAATKQ